MSSGRARRTPPPSALVREVEAETAASGARPAARLRAALASGAVLRPAGTARQAPEVLLSRRYAPIAELRLFGATLWTTGYRYDDGLGFLVAFVQLDDARGRPGRSIHPRLVYKDSSLVWRVASHFIHDEHEYWMGKGDVALVRRGGFEHRETVEETTNLPFELQFALDDISRMRKRVRDDEAVGLVLREAPTGRIEPFADFIKPRRAAAARWAIHGGRPIARFTRRGDPGSLRFAAGFEPDLVGGVVETSETRSRFFGGALRKLRVLSKNGQVQHLFFASPSHAWLAPPQALSTELSTYAVRIVDVRVPDELCVPGFEYHDDDESQIPPGFAGDPHPDDPHRADASAWLDELPPIVELRARGLAPG